MLDSLNACRASATSTSLATALCDADLRDPEAAREAGLTASDVIDAVREQNGRSPRSSRVAACAHVYSSRSPAHRGRLSTVESFRQIVIRASRAARPAPRRRRARASSARRTTRVRPLTGHLPSRSACSQLPEATRSKLAGHRAELKRLSETFPSGAEQMVRYDPTQLCRVDLRVMRTLFAAIVLVPGRLRVPRGLARHADPRRPIPLAGRHVRGALCDRFASTDHAVRARAPIGLVVDDAIVVVENVARLLPPGSRAARRSCARWAR